jgi:hypothetical protein
MYSFPESCACDVSSASPTFPVAHISRRLVSNVSCSLRMALMHIHVTFVGPSCSYITFYRACPKRIANVESIAMSSFECDISYIRFVFKF